MRKGRHREAGSRQAAVAAAAAAWRRRGAEEGPGVAASSSTVESRLQLAQRDRKSVV